MPPPALLCRFETQIFVLKCRSESKLCSDVIYRQFRQGRDVLLIRNNESDTRPICLLDKENTAKHCLKCNKHCYCEFIITFAQTRFSGLAKRLCVYLGEFHAAPEQNTALMENQHSNRVPVSVIGCYILHYVHYNRRQSSS